MESRLSTPLGTTRIHRARGDGHGELALVVPGYSETIAHSRSVVDALAREGYDAFTFSQPRKAGAGWREDPIGRQADLVLRVVEAVVPEGEAVHAVAHSLGAAAALRAAPQAPDRFASVVLMQPIGLSGPQRLREQAARVAKKAAKNQVRALRGQDPGRSPPRHYAATADTESTLRLFARVGGAQLVGLGVLFRQVGLALREASAAGSYDLAEDAAKARQLGIPVHVVKAHADELFDSERVDAGLRRVVDTVTSYSSVADPAACHDACWLQPTRSARIVDQLVRGAAVSESPG